MSSIVLGVSGGVAAYKAAFVLRAFTEAGHDVRVVPTPAALHFVGAATFEALSGNPVTTDVWSDVPEVAHVRIGQNADLVVVAPATADLLARAAMGRADDLLTATLLTASCPVVFVPAMHTEMWLHPATQDNVATLRRRGAVVLPPAVGRLTGPDSGPGRLPEPADIAALADRRARARRRRARPRPDRPPRRHQRRRHPRAAGPGPLPGQPLLGQAGLGAGPRRRRPRRRRRARRRQRRAAGPVRRARRPGRTAEELRTAMLAEAAGRRRRRHGRRGRRLPPGGRRRRQAEEGVGGRAERGRRWSATPTSSPSWSTKRAPGQLVVGFAAETGDDDADVLTHARAKLARKGCDLLVVNDVSGGQVFGRADNAVVVLAADGIGHRAAARQQGRRRRGDLDRRSRPSCPAAVTG